MNILFITHYSSLYGANKSLLDLLNGLKDFSIKPHVLTTENGLLLNELEEMQIDTFVIPFKLCVEYRWTSSNILFQLIRNFEHFINSIYRRLANEYYYLKIEKLVRVKSIDLVYTNSSVIDIGHKIVARMGIPEIFHVRELLVQQFSLQPDFGVNYYLKNIRESTCQIFISNYTRDNCISGSLLNDGFVMYDGIEIPKLQPRNRTDTCVNIGIIGYISKQKNQEELMRAIIGLPPIPKFKVFVIGGGDTEFLQEICENNNLVDLVSFEDFQKDVNYYYREVLDIAVVCSINEALGRVTMESMAFGVPVIGKDSGATSELIEHNETGLLYTDEHDLTMKLNKLLQDQELRLQLGLQGYKKAKAEFNIRPYSKQMYSIIKGVITEFS